MAHEFLGLFVDFLLQGTAQNAANLFFSLDGGGEEEFVFVRVWMERKMCDSLSLVHNINMINIQQ